MFDFLSHINLPPYLLFIVIIFGILVYYFHKDISKLIGKKEVKEDIKDLKSHNLFSTLTRVKNEAMFLKFFSHGKYDVTKSKMCSDFVKFKCDVCFLRFSEFLDAEIDKFSTDELKNIVLSDMWAMHNEYINQIKIHWLSKGIKSEDIDYAIELFEKFRHDVVLSFQHRIDAIFSCEHYNNNFKKILATYEMYAMGIDLLPKDLLTTFETINGKFANIKYN
ncbi:hypothetical protein UFOVP627_20 [uncultured Caudovirales phage]|uniref:Uncharacterized protein n=1 Tax=uncultured Caudovirales phage TaxID=2100421 RepID=A0A6J5N416_9CAUD|nr:hypothetical protein UFOVP627_20 [uncultured Caudovirales phage]